MVNKFNQDQKVNQKNHGQDKFGKQGQQNFGKGSQTIQENRSKDAKSEQNPQFGSSNWKNMPRQDQHGQQGQFRK